MKILASLLILFTLLDPGVKSEKVRDRFSSFLPEYKLKVGMGEVSLKIFAGGFIGLVIWQGGPGLYGGSGFSPTGFESLRANTRETIDAFLYAMIRKRFGNNYTLFDISADYKNGFPDGNGTYNGVLGRVQSGKLDFAVFLFNPAANPHEPVYVGPTMMPSDQKIISYANATEKKSVEVIDWLFGFDQLSYKYFCIACYIFIVFLTFLSLTGCTKSMLLILKLANSRFWRNVGQTNSLIMNQGGFDGYEVLSSRILLIAFGFFIWFSIDGIFSNLFQVEKTIEKLPPRIDSLKDLLDDPNITPAIPDGLWHLDTLRRASPETDEGKLWARINEKLPDSIIKWGFTEKTGSVTAESVTRFLIPFFNRSLVLILDEFVLSKMKLVFCRVPIHTMLDMENVTTLDLCHLSKKTFGPGSLNIPISHHTPHPVRKILEYSYRTYNEFGLIKPKMFYWAEADYPEYMGVTPYTEGLECANKRPDPMADPQPMSLKDFNGVFKYFFILLFMSSIVLVLEILCPNVFEVLEDFRIYIGFRRSKVSKRRRKRVFHIQIPTEVAANERSHTESSVDDKSTGCNDDQGNKPSGNRAEPAEDGLYYDDQEIEPVAGCSNQRTDARTQVTFRKEMSMSQVLERRTREKKNKQEEERRRIDPQNMIKRFKEKKRIGVIKEEPLFIRTNKYPFNKP